MKTLFEQGELELSPAERGFTAAAGGSSFEVEILNADRGKLDLLVNGERVTAYVSGDGARRWVTVHGRTFVLVKSTARRGNASAEAGGGMTAPMPGQVRSVEVAPGEAVKKGQTLLVIEAMKMEMRVQAPRDGTVKRLLAKQGDTVERGQLLVEMEEIEGE
jgi:biotin carboxyl carrier protein